MPVTLADMMKTAPDKKHKALVWALAYQSQLMERIPFTGVKSLTVTALRQSTVEDASFRDIGEGYGETVVATEKVTESIAPMGGTFDMDRIYTELDEEPVAMRGIQLKSKLKSIRYKFHDTFINGDRTTQPKGWDGVKRRIDDLPATTKSKVLLTGGTNGLDPKGAGSSNHSFLDKMNQAMYALPDGKCDLILCNDDGFLLFESVLRRSNLLDNTKDMFGRDIRSYRGARIVDVGTKGDQTTKIITSAEVEGSATTCTSFYFVRLGVNEHLGGLQLHAPKIVWDGVKDDGVTKRVVVEWPCGIALWHPRSVARLKGIIVS